MELWQEVILIIFSCGALIIALYCLFFMVPVKRFWERIDSLGGGVKGVEAYVDGIRDEVSRRFSEIENSVRQQMSQAQENALDAVEKVAEDSRQARRDLERMRGDLQALQAELRTAAADSGKVGRSVEVIAERLQRFQGDFDALDVKLRESVRQLVGESFKSVESTVLSALDAIQEEMLSGSPQPAPAAAPFPHRPRPTRPAAGDGRRRSERIIEPLFAGLNEGGAEGKEESEEEGATDEPE